jgi:hypothetical protein
LVSVTCSFLIVARPKVPFCSAYSSPPGTEETQVDQAYRGGQDPFPGQAPGIKMAADCLAYGRQGGPEALNPVMLVLVALLAP